MNYRFGQKETKKKIQSLNHWRIVFSVRIKIFTSSSSDLCPTESREDEETVEMTAELRSRFQLLTPQISTDDLFLPTTEKRRKRKGKRGGDSIYKNKPLGMGWGRKGRRKVATLDLPRECVSPPPPFPFFSSDFVCWWLENGWEDQESSLFPSSFFWKRKPLQGLKEKKKIC